MANLCPFGSHRVLSPVHTLPQGADKVDNRLPLRKNEILIDVGTLNLDSASFRQIWEESGHEVQGVADLVLRTVRERGKQHNPVTGSGGMLLGTVKKMGSDYPNAFGVRVGDKVATLVSLSLTPLHLDEITQVHVGRDQVEVEGYALLFPSSPLSLIPQDLPETLALAVLDVCGAPAQTHRLVKPGMTVVIVGGGGKSGLLCSAVAREALGQDGELIAVERPGASSVSRLKQLGYCDKILEVDATHTLDVHRAVFEATKGSMADLVINVANVEHTEMGAILSAKNAGIVYFFSMGTSFTRAALGAEGIGSDATLLIGNGYAPGAGPFALDLMRNHPELMKLFQEIYVS
jgi:L-erythro-3,5-diaminohexanoate dehydrogenase